MVVSTTWRKDKAGKWIRHTTLGCNFKRGSGKVYLRRRHLNKVLKLVRE